MADPANGKTQKTIYSVLGFLFLAVTTAVAFMSYHESRPHPDSASIADVTRLELKIDKMAEIMTAIQADVAVLKDRSNR